MVGTLSIPRTQVDRIHQALQRYCQMELGDPSATVDILPDEEFSDMLIVPIVSSPAFSKMSETERQDSIWEFLANDPGITDDDLSPISQIITRVD
jgi:hypothetical protein